MKRKRFYNNKILLVIVSVVLLSFLVFSFKTFVLNEKVLPSGSDRVLFSIGNSGGYSETGVDAPKNFLSISETCSPEGDYDKCFQYEKKESYSGANARAYVKILGVSSLGIYKSGYYVGDVEIPVKFEGDKFYLYKNAGTWSNLWNNIANCDSEGCRNFDEKLSKTDSILLASPGEEYIGCPVFVAYDFDCDGDCFNDNSNSPWAWAYVSGGWGWMGGDSCLNIKSVECFDDSDCGNNEFCDNSADWKDWSCKQKECNVDLDCSEFVGDSDNYCSDKNVYKIHTSATCSNKYQCIKEGNPVLVDECYLGCSEDKGICNEKTGGYIAMFSIIGLFALFLVFVFFRVIFKRKGKR